PSQQLTTIVRC
ncbi:hypothetical protein ACTFIZ_002943, partial [Dictyostelium cf. discoideum]